VIVVAGRDEKEMPEPDRTPEPVQDWGPPDPGDVGTVGTDVVPFGDAFDDPGDLSKLSKAAKNYEDHPWVTPTTKLGEIGDTGRVTCGYYHLHFERKEKGVAVNPGALLACRSKSWVSYPYSLMRNGKALRKSSWTGVTPAQVWYGKSDGPWCG
jgi:hypothetical protein